MLKKFFILLALCTLPAFAMESPQKKAKVDSDPMLICIPPAFAMENYKKRAKEKLDEKLHNAALHNDCPNARKAIQMGANLEARDFLDKTPLIVAVEKNNENMVRFLLEEGACVNAQDCYRNWTPSKLLSMHAPIK